MEKLRDPARSPAIKIKARRRRCIPTKKQMARLVDLAVENGLALRGFQLSSDGTFRVLVADRHSADNDEAAIDSHFADPEVFRRAA